MSLMQRRRVAGGVDGGGSAAEERSADQMLDDLMEDLNRPSESSAAVRSVRVVEGSERAQPEGGTQEVVVAGAGGPQPGHNGGAQGVMEGLSPDQQAVLRQAAEVLRSGVQLQWQAAPQAALVDAGRRPEHLPGGQPAALVDAGRGPEHLPGGQQAALVDAGRRPEHPPGGQMAAVVDAGMRPEHLPGGQQHAERAGGTDPGEGQRGDQRAQGVAGGGLLGPLALPAGGLEPLVLRPEGLPPGSEGDPVVYGPGGHHGGAERQQGHPPATGWTSTWFWSSASASF